MLILVGLLAAAGLVWGTGHAMHVVHHGSHSLLLTLLALGVGVALIVLVASPIFDWRVLPANGTLYLIAASAGIGVLCIEGAHVTHMNAPYYLSVALVAGLWMYGLTHGILGQGTKSPKAPSVATAPVVTSYTPLGLGTPMPAAATSTATVSAPASGSEFDPVPCGRLSERSRTKHGCK